MNNIIITGASRGIGQALALALAGPNTQLILHAKSLASLEKVTKLCEERGAKVRPFPLDLTQPETIQEAVKDLITDTGPIDTLINNAGLWIEEPFMQGNMDVWDQALDVNLKSVIHMCRFVLESMPDEGRIVFIASTASKRSYAGGTNYCAAKFGLMGFAGALFEDVRERGIKVCSIFPGVVNTDMHAGDGRLDPEKMIQADDVAQAVVYALHTPKNVCPTEIVLQPQKNPKTM